jgi:hypothetical protein
VKGIAGLLLGALLGTFIACGGNVHEPEQPPGGVNGLKRQEILALWSKIRDWRHEAHMGLDPSPQAMTQIVSRTVNDVKRVCPDGHKVPTTCNDVCNLADDICDNAERICTLADELGKDDEWAQEKCASAKASCREAKQKCCDCSATDAGTVP